MQNTSFKTNFLSKTGFFVFIFCVTLCLVSVSFSQDGNNFYDDLTPNEQKIINDLESQYLTDDKKPGLRIKGDYEINEKDLVRGDIWAIKGTLFIDGNIDGDIFMLFGDVELSEKAHINGQILAIDGKVWLEDGAVVSGDIIEKRYRYKKHREIPDEEPETTVTTRKNSFSDSYFEIDDHDMVWFDYNRVDGLTLGIQSGDFSLLKTSSRNFDILGKLGYSFASKRTQYQLGIERWLFSDFRFTLGAEIHDMTNTQDEWIIGDIENTLAALLINEDFCDYYRREGHNIYANQNIGPNINIRVGYHDDDFRNLKNKTDWSLFGKKDFRSNPLAIPNSVYNPNNTSAETLLDKSNIKSMAGSLQFDTRNSTENPTRGWYVQSFYERAGQEFSSDFDFERFILDVRRYQYIGWDENLDVRFRLGTSSGLLPPMYWFDLGGISTLRGYRFKEITGDHAILANVEYQLEIRDNDWFFLDDMNLIFFVDSGFAWFEHEQNARLLSSVPAEIHIHPKGHIFSQSAFEDLTWNNFKTDIGIAIASFDNNFRINFAKRTDRGFDDLVVTFRIRKPF